MRIKGKAEENPPQDILADSFVGGGCFLEGFVMKIIALFTEI
jgi:hypothetical protein